MIELAIISESSADEAGLLAFASGILDQECRCTDGLTFRSRGWPAVQRQLDNAVAAVAYHTQPSALLVVVDGNGSPMEPGDPKNRMELITTAARHSQSRYLRAGHRLPIICGVAYPAIEAWWHAPHDPYISESSWAQRGRPGGASFDKLSLKRSIYGADYAPLACMEQIQTAAAAHAAKQVDSIVRRFPHGMAPFVENLRKLTANL